MDGVETTNLQNGVSGKGVIADFVEEVQVKSSGYTAEYGGATGGVINVRDQERHEQLARQRAVLLGTAAGAPTGASDKSLRLQIRLGQQQGRVS